MNNLKFRLPTFEEIVEAYDKGCLKTTGKAFWTDSIPYINNQAMYVYQPATSYSNSFKVSTKENSFVFSCVSY